MNGVLTPRRTSVLISALILVGATAAALAPTSSGHVRSPSGWWHFDGVTYANDNDAPGAPKDPVNYIFKGNAPITTNWVRDRLHEAVFGWYRCGSNQRMKWRSVNHGKTSDKQDLQEGTNQCDTLLAARWHVRGWDDEEHDVQMAGHGPIDQWMVGGVHHEDNTHDIDVDWDVARLWLRDEMEGLCSYPQWQRHPEARGPFGPYKNSGWIVRIANRATPNC